MEQNAHIHLNGNHAKLRFEWIDFDGDDSFRDFRVVASGKDKRQFEFGPCGVWGFHKLRRFFGDATQMTASLGFRHPDVRCCDIHRSGDDYRFVVHFEGSGLHDEIHVQQPIVHISDAFKHSFGEAE